MQIICLQLCSYGIIRFRQVQKFNSLELRKLQNELCCDIFALYRPTKIYIANILRIRIYDQSVHFAYR